MTPFVVGRALDLALAGKVVQVRQRLAEREAGLVAVEMAAPQDRDHVGGAHRPMAGGSDLGAALVVMRRQFMDSLMDAAERQIVRRQYQNVGRQLPAQLFEGGQIAGERVALRLVGLHADIGGNARQDLVAGDQDAGLLAEQAGMLGRVPLADQHPPFPPADRDDAALGDAMIGRRHRRHAAAVIALALGENSAVLLAEPGAEGEIAALEGGILAARHVHARVQPFLVGNPQLRLPMLGQPGGHADMVGVEMRDDDPPDRPSAEMRRQRCAATPPWSRAA